MINTDANHVHIPTCSTDLTAPGISKAEITTKIERYQLKYGKVFWRVSSVMFRIIDTLLQEGQMGIIIFIFTRTWSAMLIN